MKNGIAAMMAAVLIISLIGAGCIGGDNNDENADTKVFTDILGREVTVPSHVNRIVGVASGAVRMITYLEATEIVVGVEEFEHRAPFTPYQFANPELSYLPIIGPQHGGDAELILAQEPDVIFYSCSQVDSASQEAMNNLQSKTDIPVIAIDLGDLDERKEIFYSSLRLMAEILNREDRAEYIIEFIDDALADLHERTKDIPDSEKPSVYVGGLALRGAHDILSTRASYPPFEYTNAKNVAGGLGRGHKFINEEKLLEWDPDILFVDSASYEKVLDDMKNETFRILTAVENGEIYMVMPYNRYNINHATVLANAYYVGSVLYPDQFADMAIENKANNIYEEIVGSPVYSDMANVAYGFGQLEI